MTSLHRHLPIREYVVQCTSEVPGVADVGVDLAFGRLSVVGKGFTDDVVRIAVAEAGYWVAS